MIKTMNTWRRLRLDNSSSSNVFRWNRGTGTMPMLSLISDRWHFRFPKECLLVKSPGAKWQEQTADNALGFHFTRFNLTKSVHFFRLAFASVLSSPQNGILCNAIPFSAFGVFEHSATTHLSGIFLLSISPPDYRTNADLNWREDFAVPDLTSQPVLEPRFFLVSTPGQLLWAWPKREL